MVVDVGRDRLPRAAFRPRRNGDMGARNPRHRRGAAVNRAADSTDSILLASGSPDRFRPPGAVGAGRVSSSRATRTMRIALIAAALALAQELSAQQPSTDRIRMLAMRD